MLEIVLVCHQKLFAPDILSLEKQVRAELIQIKQLEINAQFDSDHNIKLNNG